MGYFGGAFVFTEEPSWNNLGQLDLQISFRGYKHKENNVWLLDYWMPALNATHDYPFIDTHEKVLFDTFPENNTVKSFSNIRCAVTPHASNRSYGADWHKFTIAVAEVLKIPTYFFAADDEFYDFACYVSGDGTTDTIACRFDPFQVRFSKNRWTITPRIYSEDDSQPPCDEVVLETLRALPDTTVAEIVTVHGGAKFYENPTVEWPSAAGEPEEILGIGSWIHF